MPKVDRVDEAQMRLKRKHALFVGTSVGIVDRVDEAQMRLKLVDGSPRTARTSSG